MTAERRWNGWGDARVQEALKPEALAFLAQAVGEGQPMSDASFAAALAQVDAQPSRLPPHPLVDTRAETRLRASFGQSMHDWLRLRFGVLGRVTDGVAFPSDSAEVRTLLTWAREQRRAGAAVGRRHQRRRPPDASRRRAGAHAQHGPHDAAARSRPGGAARALRGRRRRPRSRGAAARPRLHAGPFPAELRAVDAGRLGGDALVGPAVGALRPHRAAVRRRHAADARARMDAADLPGVGRRPRPARMGARLRRPHRRADRGQRARHARAGRRALRRRLLPRLGQRPRRRAPASRRRRLGLSMLRLANPAETFTTLQMAGHAGASAGSSATCRCAARPRASACCSPASRAPARARCARMQRAAAAIWREHGGVSTGTRAGQEVGAAPLRGRLPAQRAVGRGLRGRHDGDRVRLAARRRDGARARDGRPRRARAARRAHALLHAPVARLCAGLQRLLDLRLPHRRRLRRARSRAGSR